VPCMRLTGVAAPDAAPENTSFPGKQSTTSTDMCRRRRITTTSRTKSKYLYLYTMPKNQTTSCPWLAFYCYCYCTELYCTFGFDRLFPWPVIQAIVYKLLSLPGDP
jgi:hypothetical protein